MNDELAAGPVATSDVAAPDPFRDNGAHLDYRTLCGVVQKLYCANAAQDARLDALERRLTDLTAQVEDAVAHQRAARLLERERQL